MLLILHLSNDERKSAQRNEEQLHSRRLFNVPLFSGYKAAMNLIHVAIVAVLVLCVTQLAILCASAIVT